MGTDQTYTPADLDRDAEAIYGGTRWRLALARDLGISARQLIRIRQGDSPMPSWMRYAMAGLRAERLPAAGMRELHDRLARLEDVVLSADK